MFEAASKIYRKISRKRWSTVCHHVCYWKITFNQTECMLLRFSLSLLQEPVVLCVCCWEQTQFSHVWQICTDSNTPWIIRKTEPHCLRWTKGCRAKSVSSCLKMSANFQEQISASFTVSISKWQYSVWLGNQRQMLFWEEQSLCFLLFTHCLSFSCCSLMILLVSSATRFWCISSCLSSSLRASSARRSSCVINSSLPWESDSQRW